jgi:DUF1680 family protein
MNRKWTRLTFLNPGFFTRRNFFKVLGAALAGSTPLSRSLSAGEKPGEITGKGSAKEIPPLLPLAFEPLPLGSIRPEGWLRSQLRIQAEGLSGHLDEFWPDVAQSGWIGGSAEGWERGPYWLDGVVPLAFLLDDPALKEKVRRWIDYIVTHQDEDGWLGPIRDKAKNRYQAYDPWPVFVALKAMTQYQEATNDERIIPSMRRFFHRLDSLLDQRPLFEWGKFRWADLVLSIHWLYQRTGEKSLLGLAAKSHSQGYDWRRHFEDFRWKDKLKVEDCDLTNHVVNNAMAVKQPGVWYRQSHDPVDREAVFKIMETLDKYHGQATGIFTGDEHYAGKNPSQGTELCAVMEYLYSLETLLSILGDPSLADRLERIAFNALPAPFKPDMCAHQYDQQANQVICKVSEDRIYTNNGPEANIFGLEPNYGCCTANMQQGWPKFAAHLWMATPDRGLAAVAYAPCQLITMIGNSKVRIDLETDYPFGDTLQFQVQAERTARFPLYLRIPSWAHEPELKIGSQPPISVRAGTFYRVEREWGEPVPLSLRLPMKAAVRRGYHNSVSIERGPLVYSLKIGEDWRLLRGEPPHAYWEVYPITPWNYALEVDTANPEKSVSFQTRISGECPFSPEGAPVQALVKGRRLPGWTIEHNAAGSLPESPVNSAEPLEDLVLIPYGAAKLRITEFPLLE